MSEIPGHTSPPYSEDSRDDALFHYTSAEGLIGILQSGEIWGTAYYCLNDESELTAGKGVLTPTFSTATHEMIRDDHPLVQTFNGRGVDIRDYATGFEQQIIGHTLHLLCTYITCFCKPTDKEDFTHGLLSQWRGYGADGGYAIQFSRKKLQAVVENVYEDHGLNYDLQDVLYTVENALKLEVLKHKDVFLQAYMDFLENLGRPLNEVMVGRAMSNPISGLTGGPLESLLDYLIHTKSQHFSAERECRLALLDMVGSESEELPTNHFNRGGLIIPYKKSPRANFPLLDCIEWIVIGPNPRMKARFKSTCQMVKAMGLDIHVRPSDIPFSRH